MIKVSIALATYNGEPYLKEQLESLTQQTILPFELVVCDDGSTDNTVKILREFSERAPFPVRIYENKTNLGFSENFFKTARLCSGEYVAFCDQDDVWLPDKISDAKVAIEDYPEAILILQNAYLCKKDLSHDGRVFPNHIFSGYHRPQSQYAFWVWPGFLQTFRKDLLNESLIENRPKNFTHHNQLIFHDRWTCLIANAVGGFVVLNNPIALYRRHENTVTNANRRINFVEKINNSHSVGSHHYIYLSELAKDKANYLRRFINKVNKEQIQDIERAANSFESIAIIQLYRSNLYSSTNGFIRFIFFFKIFINGGYLGRSMISLGWKSMLKDISRILSILK